MAPTCWRWRRISSTSGQLRPRRTAISRSSTPVRIRGMTRSATRRRLSERCGPGAWRRCDGQGAPKSAKSASNQYSRPPWRSSSRNHSSKPRAMIRGGLSRESSPEVKIGYPPLGQAIGQVDADGLEVGIAQLEPALGLDDHLGHAGERDHRADRRDRVDERPRAGRGRWRAAARPAAPPGTGTRAAPPSR